jgi:hypothetical protein
MAEERRARATRGTERREREERGGGDEKEQEQTTGINGFICPITAEVMMDPVIRCDGQTYERRAIEKWFQRGNLTSPMTGLALPTTVVTPNHALRQAMEEYFPKMTAIQNKVFELGEEASILQMELNFHKRKVEFLTERQDRLNKSQPHQNVLFAKKKTQKDKDQQPFEIFTSRLDMVHAGKSPAQLLSVGYSVQNLRQAGFSARELYLAGCKISKLRRGGYSDEEIKGAGFRKDALDGAKIK